MVKTEVKVKELHVIQVDDKTWVVTVEGEPASYQVVKVQDEWVCNCTSGMGGKFCYHKKSVIETLIAKEQRKENSLTTGKKQKQSRTIKGYEFGEVTSAYQKEIRRSDSEKALFWGMELYDTSPYYFWKRTFIIACEDIGDVKVASAISSLMQGWEFCKKASYFVDPQMVVMAILLLAESKKSTEIDDAKNFILNHRKKGMKLEVPEYALDAHTSRGKEAGKNDADWYEERNKTIPTNQWRERLMKDFPEVFVKQRDMFNNS